MSDFFNEKNTANHKPWKKALCILLSVIIAFGTLVTLTVGSSRLQDWLGIKSMLSTYAAEIVDTDGAVAVDEEAMFADNNTINLENSDGSNTIYLFSEPISFTDENGNLKTKDISVEKQSDNKLKELGYTYTNGQNDYRINFSEDSDKGLLVEFDGCSYTIIPQGKFTVDGEKSISENLDREFEIFEYENIYGVGTSLKFYPQLNGVKDEIVLSSNIGKNSFSFELKTDNCTASLNDDGTVTLVNESGESVQTFSAPFAYDSEYVEGDLKNEHYSDCAYSLEQKEDNTYILTVTVNKDWMESESTVYPIVIDPTTSNISNYKDAGIYSSATSRVIPYGNAATCCFGRTANSEYGYGRVLNYFSWPSAIKKGAAINSAYIWERETTGRTTTTYVAPCLVSEHWVEGSVTWENRPGYYSSTTMARKNINSKSTDKSGDPYWYKFNIASAVKYWADGTYHNYGLLFRSSEEDDKNYNWRAFASKQHSTSAYRPYTVINYTNDATAPTVTSVTGNATSWTKNNVTLTVNGAADNSGGVGLHSTPYSFSTTKGSYNWQSAKTKTFTSNCTVYVYVRDAWDNIRLVSTQTINKIDKTAPELPVVTDNPTEWTNSDVTLKVSSSDSDSGIAAYSFSTTEGTYSWQTTNTKTVTENTAYYIYAKDNAGNISTAATVNVNKIDKQAPTTPQVTYDAESWANTDVVLTASSTDLESGVEQYSFSDTADGYEWQNENTKTVSNISTIYVSAKDSAGNISDTFEVNLKIDKVSPNGTVALDNPDNWVKSVTITANAEDDESGLSEAPYSFSSDEGVYNWQEQNTKTITHNGTYYVYVRDLAGNITLLDTVVVDKVDSSTPSINDINLEDIGDKTVITIDAHDAQSGICQYSFDNGKTWQSENVFEIEKDSLNYLAVKVSDNVGNVSATKYYDIYKPQIYYENGKFGFYNPNPKCECDIYYSYTFIGGWTKYEDPIPINENRKFVYVSFYQNIFAINFNDHKISINNDLTTDIFDYKEIKTDYTLSYNSAEFDITRQYKDGKWSFSVFNGLAFIDNNSMIKVVTPDFNELSFVRKSRYLYENEVNGYELTVVYNEEDTEIVEYILKYGDSNYHYNISGQLVKISNEYGDLFTFTRNIRYISITDGSGRVTRLTVLSGRIINVKDASGGSIGYAYSNNNLKTVTDQAGVTLNQYEYTDGKLTKSDDKSIFYDSQGRITEYLLDNGYSTKFEYSDNNVAILTSDGSSSSITYNIWGNISSATDEYGDTTTYTYDDNQRLTKIEKNNKVISSYTYNSNGLLTSKTEDGKEYTYSYDSKDRLIQETDPDNTYNYRYDDNDRVAVKIENSIHTYYLYDNKGNVTFSGQIDSEKDYAPDAYDENYQYDSVIRYTYENGRLVKTIDVDNNCTTVNTYDNYGNIIKTATTIENEDGTESIGITEDTYDILDRLISTKSNDKETTYTYDAAGRTLLINANGEYTRTVYDNLGRVIQEIDNDDYDPALDDLPVDYLDYDVGHRYYYDSVGNLVKEINKYDIVTDYTYSSVGTLEKKSFDIYDYYYYKNGNCDRIDVSGKTIVDYDYNITDTEVSLNNGEVLNRILYADGYTEEEKTDKYGNILNKYHNGENFSYYSFLSLSSSANKLMYKNQDTNEFITTVSTDDSYSYSRGEVYGNPSFEYQISTEDGVNTVHETHFEKEFNTVINENSISYTSAGATVNLAYESDEDSQTATQTIKNGDLTIFSAEYSYNEEDERYVKSYSIGSKTYFNEYGDDGNIISDERNEYTYNDYGELVSVAGDRNASYTYDDRGNILTKTVDGATTTYSYENTDWKDQLTSVNGVELTYDANGNLKSYGEKQYTWIYGKSLGSITDGENTYSYTYNENGIRASKNINGVKTEINTINGKVLSQKTGEDILYFQYDSSDVPVGFVLNDTQYFYITNLSGDIVGITDSSGELIAEYSYDEWGKLLGITTSQENNAEQLAVAEINPLRYRGYYYDNETGYYYLQSRYYDPGLGRFISADDFAYVDTDGKFSINAYAYCANNPANFSDPLGNAYVSEAGKVVGKIIPTIYLLFDSVKLDFDFTYYLGGAIILDSDYIFKQSSFWYISFKQNFNFILNSVLYKSIKALDPNIFYEFFINAKNKKESKLIKDFGIKTVTIEYRRTSLKDSLKSYFGDIQKTIMKNISERITNIKTFTYTEYSVFYNTTTTLIMLPNYFIINTLKFFQSGNIYISESENDYYNYPPGAVATAIFATVFEIIVTLFKAFSTSKGKVIA